MNRVQVGGPVDTYQMLEILIFSNSIHNNLSIGILELIKFDNVAYDFIRNRVAFCSFIYYIPKCINKYDKRQTNAIVFYPYWIPDRCSVGHCVNIIITCNRDTRGSEYSCYFTTLLTRTNLQISEHRFRWVVVVYTMAAQRRHFHFT